MKTQRSTLLKTTPLFLSRECFLDLAFRASTRWLYSFMERHPDLKLKRRFCVEDRRVEAVNATNLSQHFVRGETIMKSTASTTLG